MFGMVSYAIKDFLIPPRTARFVSDLVRNPEDRVFRDMARIIQRSDTHGIKFESCMIGTVNSVEIQSKVSHT